MFDKWALIAYEDRGLGVFAASELLARGDAPTDVALERRVKQGQKNYRDKLLMIVRAPFKKHLHEIPWRGDYSVVVK